MTVSPKVSRTKRVEFSTRRNAQANAGTRASMALRPVTAGIRRPNVQEESREGWAMRMRSEVLWVIVLIGAASMSLAGCHRNVGDAVAAADAPTRPPAAAPADAYAARREAMVSTQLKGRDIKDGRVLDAMRQVPRHEFMPEELVRGADGLLIPLDELPEAERARSAGTGERLWGRAYEDSAQPIGWDQTISQPYVVAFMTQALKPKPTDVVLEIGTGSGYQAAVLSVLVRHVYTIEIVEPLARRSEQALKRLAYDNVTVRCGDGYQGWPEHAPFDAIIVTCAPGKPPQPLVDQLREGGRMVIPVGEEFAQTLYVLTKENGKVRQEALLPVLFVPMTGEAQQQ